jgi:hypothetical protein
LTINFQLFAQSSSSSGYTFWNPEMEAIAMKGSREGMLYLKQNNALQAGDLFNSNKQAFG